jgi:hypothetical protein
LPMKERLMQAGGKLRGMAERWWLMACGES